MSRNKRLCSRIGSVWQPANGSPRLSGVNAFAAAHIKHSSSYAFNKLAHFPPNPLASAALRFVAAFRLAATPHHAGPPEHESGTSTPDNPQHSKSCRSANVACASSLWPLQTPSGAQGVQHHLRPAHPTYHHDLRQRHRTVSAPTTTKLHGRSCGCDRRARACCTRDKASSAHARPHTGETGPPS